MKMDKNLKDIIDCIIRFDDTESIEAKGRYFDVIQKDLRKEVNDFVLDDVIKCECKNKIYVPKTDKVECMDCGRILNDSF